MISQLRDYLDRNKADMLVLCMTCCHSRLLMLTSVDCP